MKKRKKKKIIWISISIVIILLVIMVIVFGRKKSPKTIASNDLLEVSDDFEIGDYLRFGGLGVFFSSEYTGEYKTSDVSTYLDKLITKRIPKIYDMIEGYNEETLELFFEQNAKNLENMTGINNKEEFVKFAKLLQNANINFRQWDVVDALRETFKNESDKEGYAYIELMITYTNKKMVSKTMNIGLYVAQFSDMNPPYIVKTVE